MSDPIANKLRNPSEAAVNPETNHKGKRQGTCCYKISDFGDFRCDDTSTADECAAGYGEFSYRLTCAERRECMGGPGSNEAQKEIAAAVIKELKVNKMSGSIENKIRNLSKSVEKPMPTLFQAGEGLDDSIMVKKPGGPNPNTGSSCWSDIAGNPPAPWTSTAWGWTLSHTYTWMIGSMYCRRSPVSDDIRFCTPVYPGAPADPSIEGEGQVTTRDEPLLWQRLHPDFDPTNPSTWGSLFGPGGLVESYVRYWNCYRDTGECPGLTDADIRKAVDAIKELWIRRCGFAVTETGACCFPIGDFGGFSCVQTNSEAECTARSGTFYSGQTCQMIGGDNCALAPNPQKAKSQTLAAKEIASAIIKKLRDKK